MAILNLGVTSFTARTARWAVRGDGFDSVTVPMKGAASALSAYLATLTKWSAYSGDANMFLSDWDNDDDKQYPTVSLKYIGCRGGTLPTTRTSRGSGLGVVDIDDFVYSTGVGTVTVDFAEVTYSAPTETTSWISRSEAVRPTAGIYLPGTQALSYGISVIRSTGAPGINSNSYFFRRVKLQRAVADFQSDPIVPNQYWQNRSTTTWTLIAL